MHTDNRESGARELEGHAQREAVFGNTVKAKQTAERGLKLDASSQGVEVEGALALALARDTGRAEAIVQDLNRRFPLDTQVQLLWLPAIRAQVALNQWKPAEALHDLGAASPIETGDIQFITNVNCLCSYYVRGEAYLASGEGLAAAREFQRIIDHGGMVWNCWTGAMARLGLARANALQSRTSKGADADAARVHALAAYKDFLTLWKGADPNIPSTSWPKPSTRRR